MARVSKYEDTVLTVLQEHKDSRGDDKILYYWVLKELGFDTQVSMARFLFNPNYPNYESVTRVRRKLQETHPELVSENDKKRRDLAEDDFIEYARSHR
jgi:hypothetical protein